jgi:hypothetical protein
LETPFVSVVSSFIAPGWCGLNRLAGAVLERIGEIFSFELGYLLHNLSRMQPGNFRSNGYFIGSSVVETGCETVIRGRS